MRIEDEVVLPFLDSSERYAYSCGNVILTFVDCEDNGNNSLRYTIDASGGVNQRFFSYVWPRSGPLHTEVRNDATSRGRAACSLFKLIFQV